MIFSGPLIGRLASIPRKSERLPIESVALKRSSAGGQLRSSGRVWPNIRVGSGVDSDVLRGGRWRRHNEGPQRPQAARSPGSAAGRRARSPASPADFRAWASRLMAWRLGNPQKPSRSGQGRSRCRRQAWWNGTRWSTSRPRSRALAGGGAAPPLQLRQQLGLTGRRDPEFPGRDAAAVPARPAVGLALAPKVTVPAEPIDRLAAEAAGAGLGAMGRLAERGRLHPTMPLLTAF